MNDGLFYLYGNLLCNSTITLCSLWLLTDRHFHRLVRACYAFISAGAVVNVIGMVCAIIGLRHMDYGHVWPGEVVGNFGVAMLQGYWVWHSARRRFAACPPDLKEQPLSE
jgi:hypothetical protein